MIKVVKRCEFPMPDGFKCNKPFTVSSATAGSRKFCEEHIGNDSRNPHKHSENKLVTSTNVHAQESNNIAMREWVMKQMKAEAKDEQRIQKLEREVERLRGLINKSEGDKKKIAKIVRKELTSPIQKERIEAVVVKLLQRTNMRIKDIEDIVNKNGDEEE
tara:strand:+ start:10156 stop:10635 length:480 start_codon:yes stop_codon:yes gene_type:complete